MVVQITVFPEWPYPTTISIYDMSGEGRDGGNKTDNKTCDIQTSNEIVRSLSLFFMLEYSYSNTEEGAIYVYFKYSVKKNFFSDVRHTLIRKLGTDYITTFHIQRIYHIFLFILTGNIKLSNKKQYCVICKVSAINDKLSITEVKHYLSSLITKGFCHEIINRKYYLL